MEYDKNNKGSLWNKVSAKGTKYYSGTATIDNKDYRVSMFENDKQGNEKRPDFNLVFEEVKPKEQESDPYKDFGQEIELLDSELPF
jgi:hypothetical protein